MKMDTAILALLPLTTISAVAGAHAEEYPFPLITVVAPFPVGASADVAARIITGKMGEKLGTQFIVENRPGALGRLGIDELLRARPNGATIGFVNDGSTLTVMADSLARNKRPPYTPDSFTFVGEAVEIYFVLVANKDLPVNNFREFVAYARAHPGFLNVAVASPK